MEPSPGDIYFRRDQERIRRGGYTSDWGAEHYGDPCRACGYRWDRSFEVAAKFIVDLPASMAKLLEGATGTEECPDRAWSVGAYVCHVADNLRISAERFAGVLAGGSREVARYDENLLAEARRYTEISLEAAMWSLHESVTAWSQVMGLAHDFSATIVHPERGETSADAAVRHSAHDAYHHKWDIERILTSTSS